MRKVLFLAALAVIVARPATASTITFEDLSGPKFLDAPTATQQFPHYTFGALAVDFSGGTILTDESDLTGGDTSTVYATAQTIPGLLNVTDPTLTNPLLITFSAPITNFQVDILNALSGNYVLADNAGHFLAFTLSDQGNTGVTEGFAATGTQVRIQYLGGLGITDIDAVGVPWDFAIDNVTFNEPLSTVPEPATCVLLGTGIAALVARRRRQRAG